MIIDEITEKNYEQKNREETKQVEDKLNVFQKQIDRSKNSKEKETPPVNWNLLFDPTLWAYKVLRDKQNKPLLLRGYQDKIINDKHRFIVVAAANQIGKTWTACVKAIHHALHVDNASVLIVSKSEQQAIMILDEIKWMMRRSNVPFDSVIDEVENRTELHLKSMDGKGVSVIRCLPPTTGVLAYPATLVVCDEIGFWEIDKMDQTEYFNRVIISRTNATKNWHNNHFTMGQIFCISNPNGQQGVLWAHWNDEDFHQYRYNFLANPDNNLEEYKKWEKKIPGDQFDSIYAAVFASATGGFITQVEYEDAVREYRLIPQDTKYLGGDFAGEDTKSRDVDETVIIGADHLKEDGHVKVRITHRKAYPLRCKKTIVYEDIKQFPNLSKFAYDKVGIGDSVKNDLIDRGILPEYKIESLTYSLPNKSEVYYNLKHLFEQRLIVLPPGINKLKEQLLGLRFEKTDGGHMKIHHARSGMHDDWADALANVCYAAKRLQGVSPGFSPLKPKEKMITRKLYTMVCPSCEKEGKDGYYQGYPTKSVHFQRKNCPKHAVSI